MKKAAIILCGQLRSFDICIKTMQENLFPYYDCDIYCVTQDCNCIKPRIYTCDIIVNQYIFFPIKYDISNYLNQLLGDKLKKLIVRENIYEESINKLGEDLVLSNIGWADHFLEMKMAFDMAFEAEIDYDLYIKVRPDICFSKPFNNIPNPMTYNSLYVNNKDSRFIWDAVFAMDPVMAKHMHGFYDYYINKINESDTDCFKWLCSLNAEEQLLNYVTGVKADIIDLGDVGYPFTWLVGDIKNNLKWSQRHFKFNAYWQKYFISYTDKCTSCFFDVRKNIHTPNTINNVIIPPITKNNKIALLLSGQFRDFDFCIQSIIEYVFPHYQCDIYIATQDSISIKPRLGHGLYNQYIICKKNINYDIIKDRVKSCIIRKTYKNYLNDQELNLCFKTIQGPKELQTDIRANLDQALASGIDYNMYLHIRPDVLIGRHFNKLCVNTKFCEDLIICMDKTAAINYPNIELGDYKHMIANPIKWLISDIKTNKIKRHSYYGRKWSNHIEEYAKEFHPCIFDIKC